jgi:hypothetical protein
VRIDRSMYSVFDAARDVLGFAETRGRCCRWEFAERPFDVGEQLGAFLFQAAP